MIKINEQVSVTLVNGDVEWVDVLDYDKTLLKVVRVSKTETGVGSEVETGFAEQVVVLPWTSVLRVDLLPGRRG